MTHDHNPLLVDYDQRRTRGAPGARAVRLAPLPGAHHAPHPAAVPPPRVGGVALARTGRPVAGLPPPAGPARRDRGARRGSPGRGPARAVPTVGAMTSTRASPPSPRRSSPPSCSASPRPTPGRHRRRRHPLRRRPQRQDHLHRLRLRAAGPPGRRAAAEVRRARVVGRRRQRVALAMRGFARARRLPAPERRRGRVCPDAPALQDVGRRPGRRALRRHRLRRRRRPPRLRRLALALLGPQGAQGRDLADAPVREQRLDRAWARRP